MPLTRGQIVGYDANLMTFEFTMVRTDTRIVACQVSSAAMDDLSGKKGTRPSEREGQFLSLRAAIENIASDIFDDESLVGCLAVQIFAKHVRK
jgi:hypothetical protein